MTQASISIDAESSVPLAYARLRAFSHLINPAERGKSDGSIRFKTLRVS
ncbi:MAG: hypothetical protein HW389_1874, partial [Bacteroidetes bacterium]|nr:hypothetical protein [Bacteroidota bacterium]